MSKQTKLRFTGEFPPVHLLESYPNWRNAYEEESEEGQEEGTLMPHEQQSFIDEVVSFTAGEVVTASGRNHPVLLEMVAGDLVAINVLGDEPWGLELRDPSKPWAAVLQDWVSDENRVKDVSLEDVRLFPLPVVTKLPKGKGGNPIEFQINLGGLVT